MAKDKKVESITDMEQDFAQWFTDVCTKAELVDYSGVKGLFITAALRLRDMGEHTVLPGQALQGDGAHERLHAHAHTREPAAEGEGPRRGLRARVRVGHGRRQRGAARAAVHPSDERDALLRALEPYSPLLARPALPLQPVVQRAPLGEDHPPLPQGPRIPLAGGPHDTRHGRGGHSGDRADARDIRRHLREPAGHARAARRQDR